MYRHRDELEGTYWRGLGNELEAQCHPYSSACNWLFTDQVITVTKHKVCGLTDSVCIQKTDGTYWNLVNGDFSKNPNHDPLASVGDGVWAYSKTDNSGPQANNKLELLTHVLSLLLITFYYLFKRLPGIQMVGVGIFILRVPV